MNDVKETLCDLFYRRNYYKDHIDEVNIGTSDIEKLFAMFIRDPRYGYGLRDLGRELMLQSQVDPEYVVLAGRFDDLMYVSSVPALNFWYSEIKKENPLAKKWAPRLQSSKRKYALALCYIWGMTEAQYRKFIKCEDTVEYKLSFKAEDGSFPLLDKIDFMTVPIGAMRRHDSEFCNKDGELESRYLDALFKRRERAVYKGHPFFGKSEDEYEYLKEMLEIYKKNISK